MIIATDVSYDEAADRALAAAVSFERWDDAVCARSWTVEIEGLVAYQSRSGFQAST